MQDLVSRDDAKGIPTVGRNLDVVEEREVEAGLGFRTKDRPESPSRPYDAARDGCVLLDDIVKADGMRSVPEPSSPCVTSMRHVPRCLIGTYVVGQYLRVVGIWTMPSIPLRLRRTIESSYC